MPEAGNCTSVDNSVAAWHCGIISATVITFRGLPPSHGHAVVAVLSQKKMIPSESSARNGTVELVMGLDRSFESFCRFEK